METIGQQTSRDSKLMRWSMLVLISVLFFATYWFQDVFSPLKELMERDLGIDSGDFGIVVSATTWANCLGMILVGGFILDRWGIRLSAILFGLLVTAGGILTSLGASDLLTEDTSTKILLMAAGRIVFGIGLEITCVIVSRVVVKWFKGHELALAMAINVGFGRLGSFFAVSFGLDIANNQVVPALGLAASLIGAAFILLLVYLVFDKRLDRQVQKQAQETTETDDEKFRLGDFVKLVKNPTFLWIASLCVVYYSAVFPFIGAYGPSVLHHNFGFSMALPDNFGSLPLAEKVGLYLTNGPKITGLIPLGSIMFTPFFGWLIDRRGKASSMMLLGSVLLIFAHLTLTFIRIDALAYVALFCLGIAFSLVPAAMWPSVAKIVPENRLGTAYAGMFTIQNWGLALFYWLPGQILDVTDSDYTWAVSPFLVLGVISIWCALQLKKSNRRHNLGLEKPFAN
jgi:MFS family permease